MPTALLTGGSGMIGTALTNSLLQGGWSVHHLGRTLSDHPGVRSFVWDPARGTIDPNCLEGVDHIVHLAGAGIADKRWTDERIDELIDSRAGTSRLLHQCLLSTGSKVATIVSAAGINYYGAVTSDHIFEESDPPGTDTIGRISREWEAAVDEWASAARVVKLRMPIVLARSGALPKLLAPVKLGLGAAIGSGKQWMPWVHLDDLVRAYTFALENVELTGAYNVNAPSDVTNATFMRMAAKALGRPFFLPKVPATLLRMVLGELSAVILEGSRASNSRITSTGFQFRYTDPRTAVKDLL